MGYAKALKRIKALSFKELSAREYLSTRGRVCRCAIGASFLQFEKAGICGRQDNKACIFDLADRRPSVERCLAETGMTLHEAADLQLFNDRGGNRKESRHTRWRRVVRWLEKKVAQENVQEMAK
jgi:hypothetical protein